MLWPTENSGPYLFATYLYIVNSPSAVMTNTNMLATTIPAIAERLRPETT